jgi:subtilisin family serine protease
VARASLDRRHPRMRALALAGCLVLAACTGDGDESTAPIATPSAAPAGTTADVREGFARAVDALAAGEGVDATERDVLEETDPRRGCPGSGPRSPFEEGQVELEIARVEQDCLVFDYEVVSFDDLESRMTELDSDPSVLAVSPVVTEATPHEMGEERAWSFDLLDVPEPEAWTWPTGEGVRVAVVDTGIDAGHPDMDGQVVERMTFPGDPGGDHHIRSHGTHVAGIVGAVPRNGTGIAGMAPGVHILDVPVVDNPSDDAPTIADGIRWAADNDADVVNMSFGIRPVPRRSLWDRLLDIEQAGSATEALEVALIYADEAGVVLVASGGNCGDEDNLAANCQDDVNVTTMPAAAPEVWAVAATTDGDDRASFSTEREYVDLSAPGVRILSLAANGSTRELQGTSQAAPHVTAAVALLLGSDGPLSGVRERRRTSEAMTAITTSLVDLGRPGRDPSFGRGRLDIATALAGAGWVTANPFEGDWYAHNRRLTVRSDGTALYVYRLYPGIEFAEVELSFTQVGTRTAEAVVTSAVRSRDFERGDVVSLFVRPATGTVDLTNQVSDYRDMLCGPTAEPGYCGA